MTENEFAKLGRAADQPRPVIGATPNGDKTLLYGYDVERLTWHTYQKDDVLHLVVYTWPMGGNPADIEVRQVDQEEFSDALSSPDVKEGKLALHVKNAFLPCEMLVPNKRLYPEACDMAFCQGMLAKGVRLPFTTYNNKRDLTKRFHGFRADQMTPIADRVPSP